MTTKYPNIEIADFAIKNENKRLLDQIWKLIPMRENGENWEAQLVTVIQEIAGLGKILVVSENPNFLILLSKLEGLNEKCCEDFMLYRKTVFRCMSLLTKVLNNE